MKTNMAFNQNKNPLERVIESQIDKQRNNLSEEKEKKSFATKLSNFFGFLITISILLGLLFTLLSIFQ